MSSNALAVFLKNLEGRPWSEWKGGKAITQKAIANLLAPFDISPVEIRVGHQVLRGYRSSSSRTPSHAMSPEGPVPSATPLHVA